MLFQWMVCLNGQDDDGNLALVRRHLNRAEGNLLTICLQSSGSACGSTDTKCRPAQDEWTELYWASEAQTASQGPGAERGRFSPLAAVQQEESTRKGELDEPPRI